MDEKLRKVSRRSFLGQVAGGAAGVGALAVMGGTAAAAGTETIMDPPGHSDSDPTDASRSDSDPVGVNTRRGVSGYSDNDRGRYADPINNGRRGRRTMNRPYTGVSDSDTGRGADPHGYGRRRNNRCSDSDTGRYADSIGHGRRC